MSEKDDIKAKLSCIDYARQCGIKLGKAGRGWMRGPCPRCELKRDPLCVTTGEWKCHGCPGSGGDIFDLVIHLGRAHDLASAIASLSPQSPATPVTPAAPDSVEGKGNDDGDFIAKVARRGPDAAHIWQSLPTCAPADLDYLASRGLSAVASEFRANTCGPALPLFSSTGDVVNVVTRAMPGARCQSCGGDDVDCRRCSGDGKEPKTAGLGGISGKGMFGSADGAGPLIICEGWADYASARVIAPCAFVRGAHGAGNMAWLAEQSIEFVKERGAVILAHDDRDKKINAGLLNARKCAMRMTELGAEPTSIRLWTNPGGDLNDWLRAHPGEPAPWTDAPPFPFEGEERYTRTDAGNTNRWADERGQDFRYSAQQNQWYRWTGARWDLAYPQRDITWSAQSMIQEIHGKATEKADAFWFSRSLGSGRISSIVKLACAQPAVQIEPHDLDRDDFSLNCQNGTVDLRTGAIRAHCRGDLITAMTQIEYDPEAKCTIFDQFLADVFEPHPDVPEFLARWAGYCITGDISAQSLVFAHGDGGNGKGVLLRTIAKLLGDLHAPLNYQVLLNRREGRGSDNNILYALAKLRNKRLCTIPEIKKDEKLSEDLINSVTGGDEIQARFSHGNFFEYRPKFKLMMSSNAPPQIDGTDEGIWRRMLFLPFDVQFRDGRRDDKIEDKLASELPGILAWAVRGCRAWLSDGGGRAGLRVPSSVTAATSALRADTDLVAEFISTYTRRTDDAVMTPAARIYQKYEKWAKAQRANVVTAKAFGHRMHAILGLKAKPRTLNGKSVRAYQGVMICDGSDAPS